MKTAGNELRLAGIPEHTWRGIFACLLLAVLAGCGPGAAVQRNAAGTRSVALPDSGTADTAGIKAVTLPDAGSRDLGTADAGIQGGAAAGGAADSVFEIKEKMFIAQTNDVYLNPEDYMGKTIKLEGLFKSYAVEAYGTSYCFVIRYGPGCCGNDGSAGFEVAWDGGSVSENPYPEEDAWVEATGILKSYEEDGFPYLYLALSALNVKEDRGAEFVSQ
ncbi:MAG: hypothetical protein LBP81_09610 [Treponema sp.]|jgi:hypothetical protein|nr:hypothetical protein [Treponema sp.]